MSIAKAVELVLPSDVRMANLAHSLAESFAKLAGFDDEGAFEAALAVREATVNAIEHGSRTNPDADVTLTFGVNGGTMTAVVRDGGVGFDPASVADPRDEANRLGESGRGILIMRAYCDQVDFRKTESGGTEVTLSKRLDVESAGDG